VPDFFCSIYQFKGLGIQDWFDMIVYSLRMKIFFIKVIGYNNVNERVEKFHDKK